MRIRWLALVLKETFFFSLGALDADIPALELED